MEYPTPACPVCGCIDTYEKFEKYSCRFRECNRCGFLFIFPSPKQEELTGIYNRTWYKSWGMDQGDDPVVRKMKMKTAVGLLKQVEKFMEPRRLLDIGCAAGHFMEAGKQRGWEVYGVEISIYSAALAKKKFGDNVYEGPFASAPFPEAFFDCIFMSDVLEHFSDPQAALEQARTLLTEDGILVIVTPDTGSLSARILNKSWNHYEKEHLIYYNRENIQLHLNRNHFLPLVVKTAKKAMNLRYMYSQMTSYPQPLLTPIIRLITSVFPEVFLKYCFFVTLGDMLVITQKKGK